ncbi:cell division protein FtsI [Ichthyobacterium seriolicida]|uniref:Cell division protein FtsI n=1 Tax=Ichthyobacterium seriolicida TaxID=242600 RepID=A0A1J1DZB4_9FLAO|nr:cell division protein FtsI [Ichthyobacterium seriolicida]
MFFASVIVKLFIIEKNCDLHENDRDNTTKIQRKRIAALRGNIYSGDGYLLATSTSKYDIRMDVSVVREDLFSQKVRELSDSLSAFFGKNYKYYLDRLLKAKKENNRYLFIAKNISHSEFLRIKDFPIFRHGRYSGGFIYSCKITRENPLGDIASRTIGHVNNKIGIEGWFDFILRGKDGSRLKQKIFGGNWKPLNDDDKIEPDNGEDIHLTINTGIQDIAHYELLKSLKKFKADHGCVVVMEVKTGNVLAISNLGKDESSGLYQENKNYAVWESVEPGSTFKLASVMIGLEDGTMSISDKVNTDGKLSIYGNVIEDMHSWGVLGLQEIFEKSSNVGVAKLVYDKYKDRPLDFINRLYKMNLGQKLDLSIKGEGIPLIPTPKGREWSAITLAWMAFGYGIRLTPIHVLAFYNAVANDGVMLKPRFVLETRERGITKKVFPVEVINPILCSKSTLDKVKKMLEGVVLRGTAKEIYDSKLPMAGKTGTTQLEYWKGREKMGYISSFVGYFPADKPLYSCIVVINKPDKKINYYGSTVAAPVFRNIAQKIFSSIPSVLEAEELDLNKLKDKIRDNDNLSSLKKNKIPDMYGVSLERALPELEKKGLKVKVKGMGILVDQHPKPGTSFKEGSVLILKFSQDI